MARPLPVPAEVGRLVPAVPGLPQRVDDELEVRLHRLGLAFQLRSVRVREARARFRLQLVRRHVVGLERQGLGEVAFEVGGALARDPVDEVERDVVDSGITNGVHGAPDVVRSGNTFEHVQKVHVEALCADRHAVDTISAQQGRELRRHGLGIRLHGDFVRIGQRRKQALEGGGLGERRRPAAEEDRLDPGCERARLQLELAQQRIDVAGVVAATADRRHEVAVPAAVRAERQVHVQVASAAHRRARAYFRAVSFRLSTARKASCGTSTPPTCFIRFLPAFCFSSSFRLRVMSPP